MPAYTRPINTNAVAKAPAESKPAAELEAKPEGDTDTELETKPVAEAKQSGAAVAVDRKHPAWMYGGK